MTHRRDLEDLEDPNDLAGLRADDHLQTPPTVSIWVYLLSRGGVTRGDEPERTLAAVLFSAGPDDAGRSVRLGKWNAELTANEERLVSLVPLKQWAGADSLEVQVFPLAADVPAASAVELDTPAWVGSAGRETKWGSLRTDRPGTVFTDGVRALAPRLDGDDLVIDWFHTEPGPVFGEISTNNKVIRTRMQRSTTTDALTPETGWHQASTTTYARRG